MTPEDRILFACTRQELLPEHRDAVLRLAAAAPRWDQVFAKAEWHGVAPLVGINLQLCGDGLALPGEISDRFRDSRRRNGIHKRELMERVLAALPWFEAHSVDVMLVKGAALDLLVYSEPWYTVAGDIDLVLRCERGGPLFDLTRAAALALYRGSIECDYFAHHDITMSGALPVDFEWIWQAVRPIELAGHRVFVMSPEDILLSACINSCRRRFFNLRSLCDVAEIVARLRDLDWDELARRARAFRCEAIVYSALTVVRETLGCQLPPGALDHLGVRPARARLLRTLVRSLRSRGLEGPPSDRNRGAGMPGLSLLLPYASYGWEQIWRSLSRSGNWRAERRKRSSMALAAKSPRANDRR